MQRIVKGVARSEYPPGRLFLKFFQTQANKVSHQVLERDPGGGPQFGVHAYRSKPRHRVDLVQPYVAGFLLEEKVDSGQSGGVDGLKGTLRQLPDSLRLLLGYSSGNLQA